MNYEEYKKESGHFHLLKLFPSNLDFIQILSVIFLLVIGVSFIYGIGQQIGGNTYENMWKKQIVWITMGGFLWLFFTFFFDYRALKKWSLPLYAKSIFLLLAVFIWSSKINDAHRWFSIGSSSIKVQPSEFSKMALIIVNAMILSVNGFSVNRPVHLSCLIFLNAIPMGLIAMEPDLGASVIIIPVVASMIFTAGLKWRWIFIVIVVGALSVPVAYPFLKDYQKERIKVFFDPGRDPGNRGWNAMQSELAVGSGGILGKGFMHGTQHTLGFLPRTVSSTDFIFSVVAEETGFAGSVFVIFLYVLLISSAVRTALVSPDDFGRYIAIGVATVFFIHSFVNIGMTMRLMPVKGLPLPLISYGGSFILTSLASLGILQSIYRRSDTTDTGD